MSYSLYLLLMLTTISCLTTSAHLAFFLIYLTPCCFLIIGLSKLPIKSFWVQSVSCCQSLRHIDIQMKESKMAILLKFSLSLCAPVKCDAKSAPFDFWAMGPFHLLSDLFNCPVFPLNIWLICFGLIELVHISDMQTIWIWVCGDRIR